MMKKRYPEKQNVLLVNITRLGDMLQATPTIAGIKKENPAGKTTVLVERQFEAICHSLPFIDEVIAIDLSFVVRALKQDGEGVIDAYQYLTDFVEDLRSRAFDYCLNMSSSAYTALLISLIGIKRSGGWTADTSGHRRIESEWAKLFATSVFHQNRVYNSLNLVDIFRCSADVSEHPHHLLMTVKNDDAEYAETLLRSAAFTDNGPLIAIQSGASQLKRQWSPKYFAELIKILRKELKARIVLIGSPKERALAEQIKILSEEDNITVFAGNTSVTQLGGLLQKCDLLITGDTGPMHMATAVNTPVVAMFLASAYGFETGPYREDSIVIQPIIGCGPCNPNKPCALPECHDTISPQLVARLAILRLAGPILTLDSPEVGDNARAVNIYRTVFDRNGFFDMEAISPLYQDGNARYRGAYRALWLEELGGLSPSGSSYTDFCIARKKILNERIENNLDEGVRQLRLLAQQGRDSIETLESLITDTSSPPRRLGEVTERLAKIDNEIELIGYHYSALEPVTRMFIFGKENLELDEALALANEMGGIYAALERRVTRFTELLSN